MTVASLSCDLCGAFLTGSAILDPGRATSGVRLMIHPGDPLKKEDGVLTCVRCWAALRAEVGEPRSDECATCGAVVGYEDSLHLLEMTGRIGEAPLWQFCREHAVALLNRFRFTDPKLSVADLVLKADFTAR